MTPFTYSNTKWMHWLLRMAGEIDRYAEAHEMSLHEAAEALGEEIDDYTIPHLPCMRCNSMSASGGR